MDIDDWAVCPVVVKGGNLMGIEVLRTLLERREYRVSADLARDLLAGKTLSLADRAVAQHALCRSLAGLGDAQEAASAGELAVFLAREAEAWDLLGRAILDSGGAYGTAGLYEKAVARFAEFFDHKDNYQEALQYEVQIHYNTGVALHALHRYREAAVHFTNAYRHALALGNQGAADKYRRNLVWSLMRGGDLAEVPRLLAEGDRYIEANPDDLQAHFSHLNDRAFYLYLEGRHTDATPLITEVLQKAHAYRDIQAWAAMIAHYMAKAEGLWSEALRMGYIANHHAFAADRVDQIAEIKRSMQEIITDQGEGPVAEVLDQMGLRYRNG